MPIRLRERTLKNDLRYRTASSTGFTLLEVIVALAVLGIALAAVMQIFQGGLSNIHKIDLAHRAMSHAENVMNELLSDQEVVGPTGRSGTLDQDFSYTAEVSDWQEQAGGLTPEGVQPTIRLLSIVVDVHFDHDRFGKYYRLQCLKAVSTTDTGVPGSTLDPIQQLFGQRPR